MAGRLAAATLACTVGAVPLMTSGTATAAVPVVSGPFAGTVALSNCSGSLVRGPWTRDADRALVLTNGHCLETGMPAAGEVIVDRPSSRAFRLLAPGGDHDLGTLTATRIEYATMTDTDVTVYRVRSTYAQIRRKYGISALRLSDTRPRAGTRIRVVSGYWRKIYSCGLDGFVYRMREAGWTWKDSLRYTPECATIAGTSGSPVLDARTRQVIGVNNTGNEDGERCTLNNPCEVARDGTVTIRKGIGYGQQTYLLARCLGRGGDVVLGGSCRLPRPASR
ncbi:serine protease [Actinomadura sp. NBRC 104412]|uniref:trypsin-like peptidase domain-containing protein n=1 Tax=Actinomadura sp. NBRC 104412 TaxID=3032203 RepID=UPI0024A28B45|nr:trypsin-like peptidase domain-containing protein [Actinomadura sp. NBRC 104412]GLZ03206.1 serine protease [Actinomadura sp. NBRC 104412]